MALIGYARVSTEDQSTDAQVEELTAAGCTKIHRDQISGGARSRPALGQLLAEARAGDTVVVVRIDRLARSLSHLLEIIEGLEARGIHFRSLRDPIDTASPQGKFTLQILGATAEFEKALIRERTVAGLRSARAQGRVGGNPGIRAKDPATLKKISRAREQALFDRLEETAEDWVPEVRRLRPDMPWEDVTQMINARLPEGRKVWTESRLLRAVKRYVKEGFLPKEVLDRATAKSAGDRVLEIVAALAGATPQPTLQEMADRLKSMRVATPRGRSTWSVSSVKMLVDRARAQGLLQEIGPTDPS